MSESARSIRARPILVRPGMKIALSKVDAGDTGGLTDKKAARQQFKKHRRKIAELHGKLYAENRRALLVVLQGMDTAGKDGTIASVFSRLSPMGCQVVAFTAPSEEERDHDFLWRVARQLPRRGNVGVFNRSHYEAVLVERVRGFASPQEWRARFEQINVWEALASSLGTRIVKIFLHIDRKEQRRRLLSRLQDPSKRWKYQPGDLDDRKLWGDYQSAYEDALGRCSSKIAPWFIVPANAKWYRNLAVAQIVRDVLEDMAPKMPKLKELRSDERRLR